MYRRWRWVFPPAISGDLKSYTMDTNKIPPSPELRLCVALFSSSTDNSVCLVDHTTRRNASWMVSAWERRAIFHQYASNMVYITQGCHLLSTQVLVHLHSNFASVFFYRHFVFQCSNECLNYAQARFYRYHVGRTLEASPSRKRRPYSRVSLHHLYRSAILIETHTFATFQW